MLDKSHYSFLIGFTRQLVAALDDDDDDLADFLSALAMALGMLITNGGGDVGDDASGDDEGIDDDVDDGIRTPLGSADEPFHSRSASLERSRRLVGGAPADSENGIPQVGAGRKRRSASVLKKAVRRGKK